MISSLILSVVIPTYNRYDTLIPVLNTFLYWESKNFEVIIQDNTEANTEILEYLESVNRNDIFKYFYTHKRLSAIENCDFAVSNASGNYVCFIGDDDGISSYLLNCCEWMQSKNIDSVCFNRGEYIWPNMDHYFKLNYKNNGSLHLPKFSGSFHKVDFETELLRVFSSGAQNMAKIPRLYHGVIRRECLHKMFKDINTYFPGSVPDMSNAVALTKYVNTHFYVDLPLVITGQSPKSMSGKNANRKHQGEINNENSLPSDTFLKWDTRIPFYWSGPTIWAQAAIEAAKRVNISDDKYKFNFQRLYAFCFSFSSFKFYPRIFKVIFSENNLFFLTINLFLILYHLIAINSLRLFLIMKKVTFSNDSLKFEHINSVLVYIDEKMSKKSYQILENI